MGKIKTKKSAVWRSDVKIASEITITRVGRLLQYPDTSRAAVGSGAFEACVKIGGGAKRAVPYNQTGRTRACEYGKNPRQALAKAMIKFGKRLKTRSGAFNGSK